jgi:hypothetical protein
MDSSHGGYLPPEVGKLLVEDPPVRDDPLIAEPLDPLYEGL